MRCNRESPCSNCKRSRHGECVYDNPLPPPNPSRNNPRTLAPDICGAHYTASLPTPEDQSSNGRSATVASFSSPASTTPHSDLPELEALKSKVRLLEEQLTKSGTTSLTTQVSTPASNLETTSTQLGGTFHVHAQSQFGGAMVIPRAISHKTRLFGQSHFVTGLPLVSIRCR